MDRHDLHAHIGAMIEAFGRENYSLQLGSDAAEYKAAVKDLPGYSLTSPLDNAFVNLTGRFLWLRVMQGGELVGVEACRMVAAPVWRGGLRAVARSGKLFAEHGLVLPVLDDKLPVNLTGRLAYLGGGWVHEAHRSKGIMSMMVRLARAHMQRAFSATGAFAFLRARDVPLALTPSGYGFCGAAELPSAYWAASAAPETLFMVWNDTASLHRCLRAEARYQLQRPQVAAFPASPGQVA